MTPKEKARELINKLYNQITNGGSISEVLPDYVTAKKCALIAVDEIIQSLCQFGYTNTVYDDFETNKMTFADEKDPVAYWEEVRNEIGKL